MSFLATLRRNLVAEFKTLRRLAYQRRYLAPKDREDLVTRFHLLYFDSGRFGVTWRDTHWLGVPVLKCPTDLWLYQEVLHRLRPALIVETGTGYGGSALYLATICDALGHGRIISIDVDPREPLPSHPRVEFWRGSSVDPAMLARVEAAAAAAGGPVYVILDSNHARDHVLAELQAYGRFVTPGSYMVVEDTNLNGHPVEPDHGPGPYEAVEAFLAETQAFEVEGVADKFFLTFNPRGHLRKRG
ncbi:MAG: class I SAM-dependent methyltransferase [Vicinamibacteraceae bacterium]|nr:class I SAM-dependent methyltransferase [Vicinamibacteraceae bacterium]